MDKQINISYPGSLANALKLSQKDFIKEIKMSSLVKLFELGKISSGTAAKIMGLSRVDFLDNLAQYRVSSLEVGELDSDINNA